MMIAPSLNINVLNSKVDIAPVFEESKVPALGSVEQTRVRLGMEGNLFSRAGDAFQIITALIGTPYLQAKSNGKDIVILGDTNGAPVAAIERVDDVFRIFSTRGQTPLGRVTRQGKVLHVIMEGQSEPTYTIHKVAFHPSRSFSTKHVVRKGGEAVASTRYGQGSSYMLTVNAGTDLCLMACLAAIADEIYT